MQALTPTLLAAQKQGSARPYVRAVFSDYLGSIAHLRLSRYYTGSEGEYYTAIALAGDGSLNRARIDPSTKVLYTQRVATPEAGSDYTAWTSHGTVSASSAVALCARGATVMLFYVDTDTKTLRWKQSNDYGATYGSAASITTAATAVTYMVAAVSVGPSTAGQAGLFWSVGAVIWASRFNGSAWSTPAAWSNSVASVTGLACCYVWDFEVVVSGTQVTSLDAKVWTAVYGDEVEKAADTWSALMELTTATAGSNVSFLSPAIAYPGDWRLFFVEKYTGTQAYARLQSMASSAPFFREDEWREAVPFDYPTTGTAQTTADYGIAATAGLSGATWSLWLAAAAGVWYGEPHASQSLDVTADVVEAQVDFSEEDGRVRLVLRNDPTGTSPIGRYAGYGSGALASLQRGARLELMPGYYTSAGPETGFGATVWVESIEQTTGPESRLVVHARDSWWLLERWRARRQYIWPAGSATIRQILLTLCARAGIEFDSVTASAAIDALRPAFTMSPGESARAALQRLLSMTQDRPYGHHAAITTRYVTASEPVDYAYGAAHPIVSACYRDLGPQTNRARVLGSAIFNESFDYAEMESMGQRVSHTLDLNLTTSLEAADRAATTLRAAAIAARHDEVVIQGLNCGQNLLDVVEITDPQAGLVAARRRVLGITWRYETTGARPRYEMTLTLGAA